MARSILPSRARKRARKDKAAVHRRERRCARYELEVALEEALEDEEPDVPARESRDYRREIRFVVNDRRAADKVGPFKRWAKARTRHLASDVERYFAIRGLLGRSTVVTDHALGHFIDLERARNPFRGRWWRRQPNDRVRRWRSVDRLESLLVRAISTHHARINALLLETGFVRCGPGDPCWKSPDKKRRHDPSVCSRQALVKSAADATRLARDIWIRPSPELVAGLEEIFRERLAR